MASVALAASLLVPGLAPALLTELARYAREPPTVTELVRMATVTVPRAPARSAGRAPALLDVVRHGGHVSGDHVVRARLLLECRDLEDHDQRPVGRPVRSDRLAGRQGELPRCSSSRRLIFWLSASCRAGCATCSTAACDVLLNAHSASVALWCSSGLFELCGVVGRWCWWRRRRRCIVLS